LSKIVNIPAFTGVITSLDGNGPKGSAYYSQNAFVLDGSIRFRPGFIKRRTRPSGFEKCLGFQYVSRFGVPTSGSEIISIEKRSGVVRPYSFVNGVTTEIKNGTTSITLEDKFHKIVPFFGRAYIVAPGSAKTLYRHEIGDNTSFVALQDTAYTPGPGTGAITINRQPPILRNHVNTDTFAFSEFNGLSGTSAHYTSDGKLEIRGNDVFASGGTHRSTVTTGFAATDWRSHDYICITVNAGVYYTSFSPSFTNVVVTYNNGGGNVDVSCPIFETVSGDSKTISIRVYIKGIGANRQFVNKVKFELTGTAFEALAGTAVACTVQPYALGGTYLEATASTSRIWDSVRPSNGITYGYRYKNSGTGAYASLIQGTISAAESEGFTASTISGPVGARISLSAPLTTSPGFDQIEFVRLLPDGSAWKILATVANSGFPLFNDNYEDHELTALTTAAGIGVDPVPPQPPFQTTGLLCAGRYKSFMVYGFEGPQPNVRYSRALVEGFPNAAEELYSSEITYDEDDLSQPSDRALPVGGDEIIGIAADDDVLYLLGRMGVYTHAVNYPSEAIPITIVPDANPVAGPNAYCIFPVSGSRSMLAYLDNQGDLWGVQAARSLNDVSISQPIELSKDIRGEIRKRLLDDQRSEFGITDLSGAIVAYSQHDNTLRVMLGNREWVLRPEHLQTGTRFWEFNTYTLRQKLTEVVETCTPWDTNTSNAASIPPGDSAWVSTESGSQIDGQYVTTGSMGFGTLRTTETLRYTGFTAGTILPIDATITSFTYRVARKKTGDLAVTETTVQPRRFGVNSGTNRATNYSLTDTVATQEFTPSVLPSVADVNESAMELDLRYTQETWLAAWHDPASYEISVNPNSEQISGGLAPNVRVDEFTVNVLYIGPLPKPSRAFINISARAFCTATSGGSGPVFLSATVNNGFNEASGPIRIGFTQSQVEVESTGMRSVSLTDGVGSLIHTCTTTTTIDSGNPAPVDIRHRVNSATITAPTPATIQVDAAQIRVCYTAPLLGDPGPTAFNGVTTISKGAFYWIRSSGEIDEAGYDSVSNRAIVGLMRDGGQEPPEGIYEMNQYGSSNISRLVYVIPTMGTFGESVTIEARTNQVTTWGPSQKIGQNYRFGVNMIGRDVSIRFRFTEALDSIGGANVEFHNFSYQKTK
jgi:hypothetical protein